MTTEPNEGCLDFGHEWVEYVGMYGDAEIYTGQECKYCHEEREDV